MRILTLPILAVLLASATVCTGCDYFASTDTRIAHAQHSMDTGDYQSAVSELKEVLEKEPGNAKARLLLAQASLKLGDAATAAAEVQRAEAGGADKAATAQVKVDTLLAQGKPKDAAEVLAKEPEVKGAAREVREGRIKLAQAQPQAAAEQFDRAASAGSVEGQLGKAEALVAQDKLGEARGALESLLSTHADFGPAWLDLGLLDAREGRYADATKSLEKAIANAASLTQPQRVQAYAARVDVLINTGDLDAAGRALADLQKLSAGSPATFVAAARLALARGEPNAAVDRLQKVVQALPNQPELRALLVTALVAQGSMEQALAEAGQMVGDFPGNPTAVLTLARTQLQANQPDAARRTLQPLVDVASPSPQALSLAAQIEMRQGHAGGGVDFLERGVETNPGNAELKIELAVAYVAAGRADDAVKLLHEIPDGQLSAQRDRLLVIAVAATHDPKAARAEIDRALKANPGDVPLMNIAASYYTSIGDLDGARRLLDKALEARPSDVRIKLALARLDYHQGKLDDATRRVQEVLKANPGNLAGLGMMAEIAGRQGNAAELERWLEEARRADPKAIAPRVQLARDAIRAGDEKRFNQLVSELDHAGDDNAVVQSAIGALYGEAGKRDLAMQRFLRASKLDPHLPDAHVGLAQVYMTEHRDDEARRELQEALKLRPGYVPAAVPLARLDVQAGRVDSALDIARDLQRRAPRSPDPLTLEGDVLMAAHRANDAVEAYKKAMAIQPTVATAVREVFARREAGMADAEKPLADLVAARPEDVRARATLANLYLSAGDNDRAIKEYERVVAANPKDVVSLNNLAWLYDTKNDPRALETASRAYDLAQGNPSVADTYAWLLIKKGETQKGLDILSKVYDKALKNMDIQYHYAYALHAAGQSTKAREVLKRAIAANGGQAPRADVAALLKELGG